MSEVVDFSPPYQREGGVWKRDTPARLIDSIINGLDVPKLYFERSTRREKNKAGLRYQYAVIDGRQRLEAVLRFVRGDLALPDDFNFYEDPEVNAKNLKFDDLVERYPLLAQRFLNFSIPIVLVESDSGDLIEEMFLRLNASSALNAAERRNAVSGATRDAADALAAHSILVDCSPIKNARYKYKELGAKFLAIEHQFDTKGKVVDTKATTLLSLFRATHGANPSIPAGEIDRYRDKALLVLNGMARTFSDSDLLLSSIGTVVVYYIVFRDMQDGATISRANLVQFENLRRIASRMSEEEPEYARKANARLREYNVLVQSTNDGSALMRRAEILSAYLVGFDESDPIAGLDGAPEGSLPLTEGPDE